MLFRVIPKLILALLCAACAPTFDDFSQRNDCGIDQAFNVQTAEIHPHFIKFRDLKKGFKFFNLDNNSFECSVVKPEQPLHMFEAADAEAIYQESKMLSDGVKEIEFFNEISQEQTFSETVENLCETMQFSFMFGLETASGPVIGCQLTAQTQSAVMFRKNNELLDAISIAAIKIYSPLIKKSLR
jgi:hypothetical protein